VVATVTVGSSPLGVAVHPNGSRVYVANNGSGTISVIDTLSNAVVAAPFAGFGLFGIGVTPTGSHVYAASEDQNAVAVLATATNGIVGNVPVAPGPAAFGLFVASAQSCDRSDLEAALATSQSELAACQGALARATAAASQCQTQVADCTARRIQLETRVSQLESANAALTAQNQTLRAENDRLRSQGATLTDVIRSLVRALFGESPDAAVATAARDMTRPVVEAAWGAAPGDARVAQVWRAFNAGEASLNAGEWSRAVREFREAYTQADRIVAERSRSARSSR
jgi:YVTN family beta-propeller protein